MGIPIEFGYTNWRGVTSVREAIPIRVWYGSTEWHPEPQWLLTAYDVEKQADRDFALTDCNFMGGRK
jgi:predicted DNA-binding transcriptional regulator YafY